MFIINLKKTKKKNMNKYSIKILFAFAFISITTITACKKETTEKSMENGLTTSPALSTTPGGGNPNASGSPVTKDANGNYWAAGINLGATFTHPIAITSKQNGMSWSPAISGATGNGLITYNLNGPYYTAIYSSVVGGLTTNTQQAMAAYLTAFNAYVDGKSTNPAAGVPNYSTFANQYGASDLGTSIITGQFILDKTSPTFVSTRDMSFVPTVPFEAVGYVLLADYVKDGIVYTPTSDTGADIGNIINATAVNLAQQSNIKTYGASGTYDQSSGRLYVTNMVIQISPTESITYTGYLD